MKTLYKRIIYIISILLAVILIISSLFIGGGVGLAHAATSSSEVLADLRKDKDFDESDYPYVKDDYGLYVIQVAESNNKELFIYAYQPCHDTYDLKGTKVSISYGYSVNGAGLSPNLYNLSLISTSGTLDKYYVDGFTVPNDGDRYYNIVEIFRMINVEIDGEQDETNPKTDKAYPVGQQWYVCDLNDSKHYEMNTFDTLYADTVFTGNFKFQDGITWNDFMWTDFPTDCWFFCFNVEEYVIKHIFDADLFYSIKHILDSYGASGIGTSENHDITETDFRYNQVVRLTDKDVMSHSGVGLLAKDFEWNRISSSADFLDKVESQGVTVTDTQLEKIKSSQWVFTFLETERSHSSSGSGLVGGVPYYFDEYEDVFDVGLLRLHFQDVTGAYYDLGVVNDLTDPDNIADGIGAADFSIMFEDFWELFKKAIYIICGVIGLLLIIPFISPILTILKYILKALFYVVSLPFKLIKSIFKKDG